MASALETAFQVDLGGAAVGWGRCLAVHAEGPAVAAGALRRCIHAHHVVMASGGSLLCWTCMLPVWPARRARSGLGTAAWPCLAVTAGALQRCMCVHCTQTCDTCFSM